MPGYGVVSGPIIQASFRNGLWRQEFCQNSKSGYQASPRKSKARKEVSPMTLKRGPSPWRAPTVENSPVIIEPSIALACGAPTARRRERSLAKGRRVPCVRSGQDRTDPFVFTNDLRSQSHFLDFLALRGRAGQPARPAEDREWDETEFLNFVYKEYQFVPRLHTP